MPCCAIHKLMDCMHGFDWLTILSHLPAVHVTLFIENSRPRKLLLKLRTFPSKCINLMGWSLVTAEGAGCTVCWVGWRYVLCTLDLHASQQSLA